MELHPDDWAPLFQLETPLLELVVRGTLLYLAVLAFLRIMPRRTGGELAAMDLVFAVLIGDAATQALGDYGSIVEAVIVVATLMGWNYLLNFLSFHNAVIERLVSAPKLPLIRDGRLLRRNMRRELLTEDEVMEQLRKHGVDRLEDVRAAYVESEGHISVLVKKR